MRELVRQKENKFRQSLFSDRSLYSSGSHGSSPELIDKLSPLFARNGVQLYLNGHDHDYERTEPIEASKVQHMLPVAMAHS
nr:hypothetical protein [Pleurocapsa sp. FMAR1]